jgi:hypothetical protein
MTTIIILKSIEKKSTVKEILDSVVDPDEMIYFLRLPPVRCLGPLIQNINPMIEYGVEYSIDCLSEGYETSDLVEFAVDVGADRICIEISNRTVTGKARIDDLTESILLHDRISGDFVVGDHVIVLEELEYEA